MTVLKDDALSALARDHNVAQFVSWGPGSRPMPRHSEVRDRSSDWTYASADDAVRELLARSSAGTVNVRTFRPGVKSSPFHYGLASADDVVALVERYTGEGVHAIVNETIDVEDGGVSGVVLGGVFEFAPDDTPRCVEKPGTAALPATAAETLLETVYGFPVTEAAGAGERREFSIHPLRVGRRAGHVLLWEVEPVAGASLDPEITWPNRFSHHVGDKVFGLLVAHGHGFPVPRTTVFGRRVAPFAFGEPTGTAETWLRTCPTEQQPGRYTTVRGWRDPYALMAEEDPGGTAIQAIAAQEGVDATYSGATALAPGRQTLVEGVAGYGDEFMAGRDRPVTLPGDVRADVEALVDRVTERLGPVRMEWVHDGRRAWVVQLHRSTHEFRGGVLVEGEPEGWLEFAVEDGLEVLEGLIAEATAQGKGVLVVGEVGLTSHVGDLLRRAQVPSRLVGARPTP